MTRTTGKAISKTTRRSSKALATAPLKVGDRVRLTRDSRHGIVRAGQVGTVVEVKDEGKPYSDGVTVQFAVLPDPRIARMFGKDPHAPDRWLCLFPKGGRLPLEAVAGEWFSVTLSSVGNPDYGQDPDRPLYGVPRTVVSVASLREARDACRAYIREYELGGGNWSGGVVTDAAGKEVARVSYNGRVWGPGEGGAEILV